MATNVKRVPERRCVACMQMLPKKALIRVVKNDGVFTVDISGKSNGRGAYVCKSTVCVAAAKKGRRFEKAFRGQVPLDIYTQLEQFIEGMEVVNADN